MNVFDKIKGGLIVSCQALETEPLYSSKIMARMAFAAKEGGMHVLETQAFSGHPVPHGYRQHFGPRGLKL